MNPLTILVCPINAVRHIHSVIGTTSKLVAHGHRVIFVVEQAWAGKLASLGIEEYLFNVPAQSSTIAADIMAKHFLEIGLIGKLSPKAKITNMLKLFESHYVYEEWSYYNAAIKCAIKELDPDLIIADENGLMPAIYYSGIPWIRHFSTNPLFFIIDDDLPPGGSGLPYDDQSEWADFNQIRRGFVYSKSFNDTIESLGYPRYPDDLRTPNTECFIIYACPEEWNYPPLQLKPNWFNLEVFNKSPKKLVDLKTLVPEDFLDSTLNGKFTGKLIYVSMNSMGFIDLNLMKRLLSVLAKTNHKYIISKGPFYDKYELEGTNQWGDRYLPQMSILPQVDLVITHGGNNSTTEIFAQGKPMIILPLFADQHDNAQRLHETGFAVRLDPYEFTSTELIEAIDKLLCNEKLQNELQAAAKRIQATDRHEVLVDKIEQLIAGM